MPAQDNQPKPATVAEYIHQFPHAVRKKLEQCRKLIMAAAPGVVESVAYGMPAYKLNGKPLMYFAAFQHHIGLYATPSAHTRFSQQLAGYKQGKGSVQFPLDQPMPWDLIEAMIRFKRDEIGNQKS